MKLKLFFLFLIPIVVAACSTPKLKFDKTADTVILLHGFGRSNFATRSLAKEINDAGYNVIPVEYDSFDQNIDQIKEQITKKIDACCLAKPEKIHFVGHSLGGLLVRYYLDKRTINNLGNVVLVGTPNQGTPLVDHFKDKWWFFIFGESVLALSTENSNFIDQLKKPYYPTGVIAGSINPGPLDDFLEGQDDGVVPLKSALLDGMTDHVILNVNHSKMRHDDEVASQVVSFLNKTKFNPAVLK